jgi:hypothetical protein
MVIHKNNKAASRLLYYFYGPKPNWLTAVAQG